MSILQIMYVGKPTHQELTGCARLDGADVDFAPSCHGSLDDLLDKICLACLDSYASIQLKVERLPAVNLPSQEVSNEGKKETIGLDEDTAVQGGTDTSGRVLVCALKTGLVVGVGHSSGNKGCGERRGGKDCQSEEGFAEHGCSSARCRLSV